MFPLIVAVSGCGSLCLRCVCCCGRTARGQGGCSCTRDVTFCMGSQFSLADCLPSVPWWWGGKWGLVDVQMAAVWWLVGLSRAVNQWFTWLHATRSSIGLADSDWVHMIVPSTVVTLINVGDSLAACSLMPSLGSACVSCKEKDKFHGLLFDWRLCLAIWC